MTKRINFDNKIYPDLDKFFLMTIEPTKAIGQTAQGQVIINGFQVIGHADNGSKVVLFEDLKSGMPDECINLLAKNWLK